MPFRRSSRSDVRVSGDKVLGGRVSVARATGGCLVCGSVDGNCVGESHGDPVINWQPAVSDSLKTFYVEDHVYVDRQITPRRKTRYLAAVKGSWITVDKATELGLI